MVSDRLTLLRRRSVVGWAIAVISALLVWAASGTVHHMDFDYIVLPFSLISIWLLTSAWVWLDSAYRGKPADLLVVFCLLTGPLALLYYLVTRPNVPDVCVMCGNQLSNHRSACPSCGYRGIPRRVMLRLQWVWRELLKSIAGGPVDKARETAKHLAIGSAAAAVFFYFVAWIDSVVTVAAVLWLLSTACYWVLTAWWVYLDATWRRMEAVPWGLLALVTNIFGLVTYLVIRYPEPRTCPQCSASLAIHLKRCPYCGSEVEPSCPRCQAPIKQDWLFCPACAAQIARPQPVPTPEDKAQAPQAPTTVCIRGTVVDALTGAPVPDAEVKIDSRSEARSAVTNTQGRYELPDMPLRPYVLLASARGYATDAGAFEPTTGAQPQVHFALQPLSVESSSVSS